MVTFQDSIYQGLIFQDFLIHLLLISTCQTYTHVCYIYTYTGADVAYCTERPRVKYAPPPKVASKFVRQKASTQPPATELVRGEDAADVVVGNADELARIGHGLAPGPSVLFTASPRAAFPLLYVIAFVALYKMMLSNL